MAQTFINASTLGKGDIPYLPVEIRHIIWNHVYYPHALAWCSVCTKVVKKKYEDGTTVIVELNYRIWDGVIRCISCSGYPLLNFKRHQ